MPQEIEIDDVCMESYPCQHGVTVDGVKKVLGGPEIAKLLVLNGKPVPGHFKEYLSKEFIYFQEHGEWPAGFDPMQNFY